MQAVILAGGKGTRLHPYSIILPKPLVPLGDMPVLEILIRQLGRAGVTELILAVGHLGHLIEAYFGDGSRFGVCLGYAYEPAPLGTAGPLAALLDRLDPDFLVANGDLLTTLAFDRLIAAHGASRADATIGVVRRDIDSEFGIVEFDRDGRLTAYREKPRQSHFVSMGVYVLNRDAIRRHLQPGIALDMPTLMLALRDAGARVHCHAADCIWLDIGRPDDLARAQAIVASEPARFSPPA